MGRRLVRARIRGRRGLQPSSVRALLGHTCAARELLRSGAGLANQVKVAVLAAGERADVTDLLGTHRQPRRGALELRLLLGVALPLPGDENATVRQQRRS